MLRALRGEACERPPLWLMRQAGRYLPEYRQTRAAAGSFLDLCFAPDLAVEVSLQPIRRFAFDAAIIFSDILVVPHGLGQAVGFSEGHGPVLEPLRRAGDVARLSLAGLVERLAPAYEAGRRLRRAVAADTAPIRLAGAARTLGSYIVEGRTSKEFIA